MQYTLLINQSKALEWGLNSQQAMLFSFVHQVPTWATCLRIDGRTWWNISKSKITAELPLLTGKQDTAYRMLRQLAHAGVIELSSTGNRTYILITEKGLEWNRQPGQGSEKNPSRVGKKSEQGSEKFPTNHSTNDHSTNISNPQITSGDVNGAFDTFWSAGMAKVGKAKARARFEKLVRQSSEPPQALADRLAADVRARLDAGVFGFEKMHPTTYLNGERWNDEIVADNRATNPAPRHNDLPPATDDGLGRGSDGGFTL